MQISDNLIKTGLAVLQQVPTAGQPKAAQPASRHPTPGAHASVASPDGAAAKSALAKLSAGGELGDAVRALKAEGRLPPRGSLVNIRV